MSEQKPSIGRIVHYVSYGTPGGEYLSECRAAVITEVHNDTTVGLCVLNPTGVFFHRSISYRELERNSKGTGGSWHWPERV